jgi:hypothetical protein
MPITFDEAKRIALAQVPEGGVLLEIIPKPYGWYFYYQSREYAETGDWLNLWVGHAGFVVDKADGHIFNFPSAYPREENFRRYELGFNVKEYDLLITEILDIDLAVSHLSNLSLYYPVPNQEFGEIYTEQEIREQLQTLPCTFSKQRFYFRVQELESMKWAKCLVFSVMDHKTKQPVPMKLSEDSWVDTYAHNADNPTLDDDK